MSSILKSVKIGLKISLVLLPKFVLTALGLVLANTIALYSPYLAWQFWFPTKGKVSAVARKESGRSLEQGGPGSAVRLTPLEAAFVVCCFWGLGIASVEGIVIFSMQDVKPEMSWALRAGHAAGLAVGLGAGLGLMALLVGGCAKFVEWGAAKEKGEGWEKVEVESQEGEKNMEKSQ